jgi:hypothetical protein
MSETTTELTPALAASHASWRCVQTHDREGWLGLMADGIVIEDPIGKAITNPDGLGVRGKEAAAGGGPKRARQSALNRASAGPTAALAPAATGSSASRALTRSAPLHQSPTRHLWMKVGMRTTVGTQKRRPSPGGEEARVVVYQPRGVGLMHSRHKPSDAHYTHGAAARRKVYTQLKTTFLL